MNHQHKLWYYPFISIINNKIVFDISKASFETVNDTLTWFPHSDNYTHFHLDFFGPWAEYFIQEKVLPSSKLIVREEVRKDWKKDFFNAFNLPQKSYDNLISGSLKLYKIKKAIVPVSPSLFRTLYYTRKLHRRLFDQHNTVHDTYVIPVLYMKRSNNEVQRVVNSSK